MLLRRARGEASGDLMETLEKRRPVTRLHDDIVIACQDDLTFMNRLHSETMQLIVTTPPYNIGKAYESRSPLDAYVQGRDGDAGESLGFIPRREPLALEIVTK